MKQRNDNGSCKNSSNINAQKHKWRSGSALNLRRHHWASELIGVVRQNRRRLQQNAVTL
jgi:hypothetical protein